jgi:hypothetical protein
MGRLSVVLAALLLAGCALHRMPTAAPSHPNETHVLAETQRFAERLGITVRGVITTKPHMVPASRPEFDGEKVPASGTWRKCRFFRDSRIEYYRPLIQEGTQEWATRLAAHEVAHAFYNDDGDSGGKAAEDRADACARLLVAGEGCPR